jgi:Homing endonuclease associated repeat
VQPALSRMLSQASGRRRACSRPSGGSSASWGASRPWGDLERPPAGYPNKAVINRKLGSWGAACRELGWHAEPRVISSDEQMLHALRAAAAELGAEFAHEEYKAISTSRGWPSANAITARFAAWNRAREMAGLPVVRPQQRGWTHEQLIRALRATARRIGGTPMAQDWNRLAAELG